MTFAGSGVKRKQIWQLRAINPNLNLLLSREFFYIPWPEATSNFNVNSIWPHGIVYTAWFCLHHVADSGATWKQIWLLRVFNLNLNSICSLWQFTSRDICLYYVDKNLLT